MKSKRTSLTVVFGIFLLITVLIFAVRNYFMGRSCRRDLEYSYQRALGELSESLGEMTLALDKSEFCSTAGLQLELSTAIIASGSTAKSAAAALPFSPQHSAAVEDIISTCQDYSFQAAKKLAAGEVFSEEDHETLSLMSSYTGKLLESIDGIREELDENEGSITKVRRLLGNTLNIPEVNFDDSLSETAEEMNSFPVLLYDGPFSDHISSMEPALLMGEEEISEEEALQTAADFFGLETEGLECRPQREGTLPVYQVRGPEVSVNVTCRGGHVSWAKLSLPVPDAYLSREEALDIAEEFLDETGLGDMEESYYALGDNIISVNFHAEQDDIILYPDLVKISIELGKGGVVEYDATGYIMNHRRRSDTRPVISSGEAAEVLRPGLEILESGLAIIPTPGKHELLCYEFLCESEDGTRVLVYINAATGLEQQIFILQETEGGVLVS